MTSKLQRKHLNCLRNRWKNYPALATTKLHLNGNKMARWIVQKKFNRLPRLKNPVLVEGLPGMGQVGKIAVDFLIDALKPKMLYKIYSHDFWHSVYFNDEGFVELP